MTTTLTAPQLHAIRRRLESETRTLIARLGRECGAEIPSSLVLQTGAAALLQRSGDFRRRPEHPAHLTADALHVAAMAVASLGAVVSQMDANAQHGRKPEVRMETIKRDLHREANGALLSARSWLNLWANSTEGL